VLGPDATAAQRAELKKGLTAALNFALGQKKALDNLSSATGQKDTEEGYGRLDALNRIGNQVFSTDMTLSGVTGFEKNLHMRDAPVSFPPVWNVPWFLWAQYDASIQQPLIRNAGEALGVSALVNLSPDTAPDSHFRSSVDVENLHAIETMIAGPNPFAQTCSPAMMTGRSTLPRSNGAGRSMRRFAWNAISVRSTTPFSTRSTRTSASGMTPIGRRMGTAWFWKRFRRAWLEWAPTRAKRMS
jgi:hypothetical protein